MNTVFVDVDTQLDFVVPAGALYAPGTESICDNLRILTQHAAHRRIKIIATVDAHAENDAEFAEWKPHCVAGTSGQQKLVLTTLAGSHVIATRAGALDPEAALSAPQIVFEKQNVDCFSNPNLTPLLDRLGPARFVVYGVVTEVCVLYAARGLLSAGRPVEIVADAVWPVSTKTGSEAMNELLNRGAKLTTVSQLVA
jgi:nicotinamidase/pyrazinamidase